MTLKIGFLQFLKGQKELEEVFIKNLFDYNLSIGKCLLTISWSELCITTVDTLTRNKRKKKNNTWTTWRSKMTSTWATIKSGCQKIISRMRFESIQNLHTLSVGWPKMSKTSKTEKYLWDTKFSHYLGQKHGRNAKK